MQVGIDFGTTNSSAAVYDGRQVRLLEIDPRHATPTIMRSALFITRDGVPIIGSEAIDRYLSGNVGRTIEYVWRYVGETELTLADVGTVMQALYAPVDADVPGRLFQSLKSHLRDRSFTGTNVFGVHYTLETLVAVVLRGMLERIERQLGTPVDHVVMGRPVRYAADATLDALALERMRLACREAGLPSVSFLAEPTAAAYAFAADAVGPSCVLVFDAGGGTIDVTVMRIGAERHVEVLATDGVPIGGDLLDQRLVMGRLLHHFGDGATLGPRRLPLPAVLLEHLGEWQSIIDLTQPRYLAIIEEAIRTGDRPRELRQLQTLVAENYGLTLYAAVEQAKVQLSSALAADVRIAVPGIDVHERITRREIERLIGPDVRAVAECVDRALRAAGVTPQQVDVVLRTGGSSRVPAFVRMLEQRFGAARLREMDVFTGVASGLAIAAFEGYRG
jgi:hypothetical chaperone protein